MVTSAALPALQAFRSRLYGCCTGRRDALFELVMRAVDRRQRPVAGYLSLEPIHRRGWGSTYAALATGQVDAEALRTLLARHQLVGGQPIYAVDVSIWPRWDAEASPERGFYHHPSRHSAGQPIVAGWAYQWIAQLELARDRWTAPVDARRLHPRDNANQVAITQLHMLVERLPAGQVPLFVLDAGYDPVQLGQGWPVPARRSWCGCALAAASTPTRHPLHRVESAGPAATAPSSTPTTDQLAGADRSARQRRRPGRHRHGCRVGGAASQAAAAPDPRGQATRPIVRGILIRVQVSRIPARTRPPKVLWLWWQGSGAPDLEVLWRGLRAPLRPRAHHSLL
jgi:hypothetical protein